jgi:hypothetical protein
MIPRRLVAAVGLAAQRGWDEQAGRLAQSTGDSLRMLRYLRGQQAALLDAAARRCGNPRTLGLFTAVIAAAA